VTDSGGVEHIFNAAAEHEYWLDFNPRENPDSDISNAVLITTRIFEPPRKSYVQEENSYFMAPRRVDVIFGPFDS
jgi:hypothetical protein